MIVARGIAGFGAGGEYPVCATSATEAADETAQLRQRRGFLVAVTTDFAVDLVCDIFTVQICRYTYEKTGVRCRRFGRFDCAGLLSPAELGGCVEGQLWPGLYCKCC